MKDFILATILVVVIASFFAIILREAYGRELDRQDAVREYNCKHYGAAINKHYGSEVCPPTPHG